MKKWFIALLFVFACLPVVSVKAAPPQTYIHLDYEVNTIVGDYYDLGGGIYSPRAGQWSHSNKIQIPKNVDKLYFSGWYTHFILFYNNDSYIGFYHEEDYAYDVTWVGSEEEKTLGSYSYAGDSIYMLDVPANATHILLQSCLNISAAGLGDYMAPMPIEFRSTSKPLIYYPAPTDAATNMTFGLMPALMIMIVIAGLVGGLIMITKKSKR